MVEINSSSSIIVNAEVNFTHYSNGKCVGHGGGRMSDDRHLHRLEATHTKREDVGTFSLFSHPMAILLLMPL